MAAPSQDDEPLRAALADSQRLGMLGRQPVERAIEHAMAFVDALEPVHGWVVDLGSGGGVPGLAVAWHRRDLTGVVLTERREARADHLRRLVRRLHLGNVTVLSGDASSLPTGRFDGVTARSFAPPAGTVAVAARLLRNGGRLVVSEPPQFDPERWPTEMLRRHGLWRLSHEDQRVFVAQRTFHVEQGKGDVPRETNDA